MARKKARREFIPYGWELLDMVDADTMDINVDLTHRVLFEVRVRLTEKGNTGLVFFDAVEKKEHLGIEATAFVKAWLTRPGVIYHSYALIDEEYAKLLPKKNLEGKFGRALGNFSRPVIDEFGQVQFEWLTDAIRAAGYEKKKEK